MTLNPQKTFWGIKCHETREKHPDEVIPVDPGLRQKGSGPVRFK